LPGVVLASAANAVAAAVKIVILMLGPCLETIVYGCVALPSPD